MLYNIQYMLLVVMMVRFIFNFLVITSFIVEGVFRGGGARGAVTLDP